MKRLLPFLLFILLGSGLHAQDLPGHRKNWNAQWITFPGPALTLWTGIFPQEVKDYGVYKFRKTFTLDAKPATFTVHVSADNRYKLYVNGMQVSEGPARGDVYHWNYETVDLAPHLKAGTNVIAALVWNEGAWKPEAQISLMTAFVLQGATAAEEIVNTNVSWKSKKDEGYQPLPARSTGYYVAGPGELIDLRKQLTNWEKPEFNDSEWAPARYVLPAQLKGAFDFSPHAWMLVPRPIPAMEQTVQRLQSVRKAKGITPPPGFPQSPAPLVVPAKTKVSLILDNGALTNAYPTLRFSKGRGAALSVTYTEALYLHTNQKLSGNWVPHMPKGNRQEIEGKLLIGRRDSLLSDGTDNQTFTSLWWRTYRYVMLNIETKDEPLTVEDIYGTFTGYPFQLNAKLETDLPALQKNMEIGWRTARLCANETYMDCPYYEQLQYVGDTRIQAMVSLYNSGDDRLVKNAIDQIDNSRLAEGLTMSRFPTAMPQLIPPFSLWWIGMVHDYWRYGRDTTYVKEKLPGVRQVLTAFQRYQQPDGSLRNVPYWIFSDWVEGFGWKDGVAPLGKDGSSAVLDLQLLLAFQAAAQLEAAEGLKDMAAAYEAKARQLALVIQQQYWDSGRGLYADTSDKQYFSQHTNSLAILAGVAPAQPASEIGRKLLTDTSLAPASIYFKYYLHQALVKAGYGNDYLKWLSKWDENIQMGLTTWSEISDVNNARSDCHAWGSSPNIEFFRIVLGIDSDAPGFSKVRIEPRLGDLKKIGGEMPHPKGKIAVRYAFEKGKWVMEVNLPAGLSGQFVWKEKMYELSEGRNRIQI